jgi:hypothetical protein
MLCLIVIRFHDIKANILINYKYNVPNQIKSYIRQTQLKLTHKYKVRRRTRMKIFSLTITTLSVKIMDYITSLNYYKKID